MSSRRMRQETNPSERAIRKAGLVTSQARAFLRPVVVDRHLSELVAAELITIGHVLLLVLLHDDRRTTAGELLDPVVVTLD